MPQSMSEFCAVVPREILWFHNFPPSGPEFCGSGWWSQRHRLRRRKYLRGTLQGMYHLYLIFYMNVHNWNSNWIYRMKFTQDYALSGEDWLQLPIQEITIMNLNFSSHWEPLLNYRTSIPFSEKLVATPCSTWWGLNLLIYWIINNFLSKIF